MGVNPVVLDGELVVRSFGVDGGPEEAWMELVDRLVVPWAELGSETLHPRRP